VKAVDIQVTTTDSHDVCMSLTWTDAKFMCKVPVLNFLATKKLAQAVTILTCIQKVPVSNPGKDTDYCVRMLS
jgi:hypothetical protein